MPIFYKGAGVETYWHERDARVLGFSAAEPALAPTINGLMLHVARGSVRSPYVSLTRSFGVAWDYAVNGGRVAATQDRPGYIYEIELDAPLPPGLTLLDPVVEVAKNTPDPLHPIPYQHEGSKGFLLGVVDPVRMGRYLKQRCIQPPPGGGTPQTPHISQHLETLVRALRDAEVLAIGTIPRAQIRDRINVFPDRE
jgi:hypothetical protein